MNFLLTFVLIFGSLQLLANDTSSLLSVEEFKTLSRNDQARYLKTLQKIFAAMAKQTLFMASESTTQNSRMPANAVPQGNQSPFSDLEFAYANLSDKNKGATIGGTELGIQTQAAQSVPKNTTVVATMPKAPEAKKTSPVVLEKNIPIEAKESQSFFRCMYAGWVITKDPCTGFDKIPDTFSIKGTDPNKMICENSQTMCNPYVFGLQLPKNCKRISDRDCIKQVVPLCVAKGAWPTIDCYNKSTLQNTLVAADLNSEIEPAKYNFFTESYKSLCDNENIKKNPFAEVRNGKKRTTPPPDVIRRDIEITCSWAEKHLKLVKEALLTTGTASKGTPAADERAKANALAKEKFESQK